MGIRTLLSAMLVLCWASSASAQGAGDVSKPTPGGQTFQQSGLDWIRIQFSKHFNREPYGWSVTQVERQFGVVFDAARIAGGDGISARDGDLALDIRRARQRANAIRDVLTADINGDLKVTREEARMMLRHRFAKRSMQHRPARMQRDFDRIFVNDRNRDGAITVDEIIASHEVRSVVRGSSVYRYGAKGLAPMTLDRNGDSVVTRGEFLAAVRVVFAEVDRDGDTLLSDSEMQQFMATIRDVRRRQSRERRRLFSARRIARRIMRCSFPALPDSSRLVFAAAYRGQALANVSIKGKQHLMTLIQVDIEPGPDPLTLVLSAPANVIWQITGAKQRVAKALIGSRFRIGGKSTVAVAGIAASKAHFIGTSNCLPTHFRSGAEREQIARALKAAMRIRPEAVVALNIGGKVSFPSGKAGDAGGNPQGVALPKDSPGSVLWKAVARSFPAGIVRLDAGSVVSQSPVAVAPVLPGRAGLAQLIDQGALELSPGAAGRPSRTIVLPIDELRIVAPIHMPTGLSQAIVRKFVLASGTKMPQGLQSQVCVVNEADGKPVAGSGPCRR